MRSSSPKLASADRSACAGPHLITRVSIMLLLVVLSGWPLASARSSEVRGEWPLAPRPEVVHPFAPPDTPWGSGHRGVDLAGSPGQSVLAVLPGSVTLVKVIAGRGVVVIDHGATRTTYEPVLSDLAVGAQVEAGTKIGLLTTAQSHCAPAACLHLGWIRNADDVYLDPLDLFGVAEVRLLPLRLTSDGDRTDDPTYGAGFAGASRPQARGWACW